MSKVSGPLLRYYGGKWKLAPWIISHFPPHDVYVEPFCGAASVLLRKEEARFELVFDCDGLVMNLLRTVRDGTTCKVLAQQVARTPYCREEFDGAWPITGGCTNSIEWARRVLVRSFMSHGCCGIHRRTTGFQRCGDNRPDITWAGLPRRLLQISERLCKTVMLTTPLFCTTSGNLDNGMPRDSRETLFYVDPPYWEGGRQPSQKYAFELSKEQHVELADRLHRTQGMVILSGYRSPLYDRLYRGWNSVSKEHVGNKGKRTEEVLWLNPMAWHRLRGEREPMFVEFSPGEAVSIRTFQPEKAAV